jgi:hypothetical protein
MSYLPCCIVRYTRPVSSRVRELAEMVKRTGPIPPRYQGRQVAIVYLEPEAFTALQSIAAKEQTTLQTLLVEGVNCVFKARGLNQAVKPA